MKSVSAKKIYIVFGSIFLTLSTLFLLLLFMNIRSIVGMYPEITGKAYSFFIMAVIFIILLLMTSISFLWFMRAEIVKFSDKMCKLIDDAISDKQMVYFETNKESLMSKLENRLKKLIDMINYQRQKNMDEQNNVKSLILDISHQVKTPIANISMYNATLMEREVTKEQEQKFLYNMESQISKLQWLMEALIKMSRLETGLICLNKTSSKIEETIAQAIGGIYLKAEEKNISVAIDCDRNIQLCHDKKWTIEAILNILENAIKYTQCGGAIKIEVKEFEMFTRINVKDNGMGIEKDDINNIFKRFYRGTEALDKEGVGVGLYLAREIISKQGGYIKVKSKKDIGSTFSIFLQN